MNVQYDMVAEALHWLAHHQAEQPSLSALARHLDLSEAHVQRTFQAFAGVSPKQFLKYLTREQALERLRHGQTVLDTAIDCGLSGPSRLHDLLITTEAITPGQARQHGAGLTLEFGVGPTPFGPALLAWSERGIVFLGFTRDRGREAAVTELHAQWPDAELVERSADANRHLAEMFNGTRRQPLRIWLRGSPFQLKVWQALLGIAPGTHVSYGDIARSLQIPSASRAVGTAISRNPVSWLIPCHRVINSMGAMGGYRWGTETKRVLVAYEAAGASTRIA